MADDSDRNQRGILGDINPVPSARDHMPGSSGEDDDTPQHAGSRDVSGATGNAGTEVGGTRNYRTGTGFSGGDLGNHPA